MTRTQKKCLVASLGTHGLLLLLLIVGPAFFELNQKPETHRFVTMIPVNVLDNALSHDAGNAQPAPPPAPASQPQPPTPLPIPPVPSQAQPTPAPPVVQRPQPQPKPDPLPPVKNGEIFKPVTPKTPTTSEFTPVSGPTPKPKAKTPTTPADTSAIQLANAQAIANRLNKRISKLNSVLADDNSVQISPGADTGEAVANYRDVVFSVYYVAWQAPASVTQESATVTARITISRDGRVTHHEVTKPSGNAAMDRTIDKTLENVTFVAPFPAGSEDPERTYSIKFDISAKQTMQ